MDVAAEESTILPTVNRLPLNQQVPFVAGQNNAGAPLSPLGRQRLQVEVDRRMQHQRLPTPAGVKRRASIAPMQVQLQDPNDELQVLHGGHPFVSGVAGVVSVGRNLPQPVHIHNVALSVQSFEEKFATLVDLFPKIDQNYLRVALQNCGTVLFTSNWILEQPSNSIPKAPLKPVQKLDRPPTPDRNAPSSSTATSKSDVNKNALPPLVYWNSLEDLKSADFFSEAYWQSVLKSAGLSYWPSPLYISEAENCLIFDFPWFYQRDLNKAFATTFRYRYSLMVRCLQDAISQLLRIAGKTEIDVFHDEKVLWLTVVMSEQMFSSKTRGECSTCSASSGEEQLVRVKLQVLRKPRESLVLPQSKDPLFTKELEWFKIKHLLDQNEVSATSAAESLLECTICCNQYEFGDMRTCSDGHIFCKTCIKMYVEEAIYGGGGRDIKCMLTDCTARILHGTLVEVLSPTKLKQLEERIQEEDLNLAGLDNLVRCKDCGFAVQLEVDITENKVFSCPSCFQETCRQCGCKWDEEHWGKPCKAMESNTVTDVRKEYEEKMTAALVRYCHKCKSPILKEEGCNKITCRCGATSCYICRTPDINYKHFCPHPLDPGTKCKHCTACLLWENPKAKDQAALAELETQKENAVKDAFSKGKEWINPAAQPRPVNQ